MATLTRDGVTTSVGETSGEFSQRLRTKRIAERGLSKSEKAGLSAEQVKAIEEQSRDIASRSEAEQKKIFETGKIPVKTQPKTVTQVQQEQQKKVITSYVAYDTARQQSRQANVFEVALAQKREQEQSLMSREVSKQPVQVQTVEEYLMTEPKDKTVIVKQTSTPSSITQEVQAEYKTESPYKLKETDKGFTPEGKISEFKQPSLFEKATARGKSFISSATQGFFKTGYETGEAIRSDQPEKVAGATIGLVGTIASAPQLAQGKPTKAIVSRAGAFLLEKAPKVYGVLKSGVNIFSKKEVAYPLLAVYAVGEGKKLSDINKKEGDMGVVRELRKEATIFSQISGAFKGFEESKALGVKNIFSKKLSKDVIIREVPEVPAVVSREVSVDVYGKPVEQMIGARVTTKTPQGTTSKGALQFELGEPQLIPKESLDYNYVVLEGMKKTDVITGKRAEFNIKSKLPARTGELISSPTAGQSSITQPYQKVIKKGLFENILTIKGTSAKATDEGVTITEFLPKDNKILATQKMVSSKASKIPVIETEQVIARPYALDVKGKPFSTDIVKAGNEPFDFGQTDVYESTLSGKEVGAKARSKEVTGKTKKELTGKEIKTYDFKGGQAKQLFVYERADVMLKTFGTKENPVFETVNIFSKETAPLSAGISIKEKPVKKEKKEETKKPINIFSGDKEVVNADGTISILAPQEQKQETLSMTKQEQKQQQEQKTKQEQEQKQKQKAKTIFTSKSENKVFIKQTQVVESKVESQQKQEVKQESKSLVTSGLRFRSKSANANIQSQKPAMDFLPSQEQKVAQLPKEAQLPKQAQDIIQEQKQEQKQDFKEEQQRTKNINRFIEEKPKVPFLTLPKPSFDNKKNKGSFGVEVRRGGEFKMLSQTFETEEQAKRFGMGIVGQSAAASFKTYKATKEASDRGVGFRVSPENFAPSKKEAGVFVEKVGKRLKKGGRKEYLQVRRGDKYSL